MKRSGIYAAAFFLSACGNPGGISDSDYAKYKELAAPKILYSCTRERHMDATAALQCLEIKNANKELACLEKVQSDTKKPFIDVGYAAGVGVAVTYNKLLGDAKAACDKDISIRFSKGEFKILDSKS